MRVVLRDDAGILLVLRDGDLDTALREETGVVRALSTERWVLGVPMSLIGVISRDPYERYELSEEETRVLLDQVQHVAGPGVDEPWLLPRERRELERREREERQSQEQAEKLTAD